MPDPVTITDLPLPGRSQAPAAVPPPRFNDATFSNYVPGNDSQVRACQAAREFVPKEAPHGGGVWWRKLGRRFLSARGRRADESSPGLYLDGGYGVGKTHLLAAAFHAAQGVPRAYLTFQELVHLIGALGMEEATRLYGSVRLLCLDEFELDDPGNTLIVKKFLEFLFSAGGSVMTTSNTPPEAQGAGRFNAEDFRREIQGIAGRFAVVSLEGRDYRSREGVSRLLSNSELGRLVQAHDGDGGVTATLDQLLEVLASLHPVRYRSLLEGIGTLYLSQVRPIHKQTEALRFVHFIDALYDRQGRLHASGEIALSELFDESYRHSAYAKKHERCISRLGELIEESRLPGKDKDRNDGSADSQAAD